MAIHTHGSFAVSTQGNYKVNNTPTLAAAALGVTRQDAWVSPTVTTDLGDKTITGTVTVSGTGDKGTLAVKATQTFTLDPAAYAFASKTDTIDMNGFSIGDSFTITVPTNAGGTGAAITVITEGVDATGSASTTSTAVAIGCSSGPSAGTVAETMVDAINGFFGSGGTYNHAFASANTGVNTGVPGVTATLSGSTKITLTATAPTSVGNATAIANVSGNAATDGTFSGGGDIALSGATITLISAVDSISKTYTFVAAGANALLNECNMGATPTAGASNFSTLVLNTNKGHGTGRFSVALDAGEVTVTQALAGAGVQGNTDTTVGGNVEEIFSVSPTSKFIGGVDQIPVSFQMQVSMDGTNWSNKENSITLIENLDLSVGGTYVGTIPSTAMIQAPYYRTGINVDEDANTTGVSNTLIVSQGFSYAYSS